MFGKPFSLMIACIALTFGIAANAQQVGQLNPAVSSPSPLNQGMSRAPSSPDDHVAWYSFLSCVTRENSQGMTTSRFYVYFIPNRSNRATKDAWDRQFSKAELGPPINCPVAVSSNSGCPRPS
jgi:hypothetical protein